MHTYIYIYRHAHILWRSIGYVHMHIYIHTVDILPIYIYIYMYMHQSYQHFCFQQIIGVSKAPLESAQFRQFLASCHHYSLKMEEIMSSS